MPKINVYLPDDLAVAVKESGLSVSPICQKALEEAVLRVKNLRRAVAVIRDPSSESRERPSTESRLWEYMTQRLKHANQLVRETVGPQKTIETKDLLVGLIDEGENMAVRVLRSLGVDVDDLRSAAARVDPREDFPTSEANSASTGEHDEVRDDEAALWQRLSQPARSALASALETSVDLGHNYLGCEHLLFGLVSTVESGAGRVLDSFGVELGNLRRAVNGAVAGYNLRKESADTDDERKFENIIQRLAALEDRLPPKS